MKEKRYKGRKLTSEEAREMALIGVKKRQQKGIHVRHAHKDREGFRQLYNKCEVEHQLKYGPIEVLALIMNGRSLAPREHEFMKKIRSRNWYISHMKNPPKWWDQFYKDASESLASQPVTHEQIIMAAKELLSYMYPKLKAIDLKSSDKSMTPVLNLLLGNELKKKAEEAQDEEAVDAEIVEPDGS